MKRNQDDSNAVSLGLRPREAAKALGIGERLLWSMTNAGEIPHLRIGRAIVYPVDMLRDWMAEQATKSAKSQKGG
ncbi:MAG: helix-turn-helix domain-containing protein [Planctomycetes bacterium]|nr:helix-turn-helix domain-containing protein [Planctomycetota bacterium]